MSGRLLQWRAWLWWLLPLAAFLVVLGVETDWGRRLHWVPDVAPPVEPKAVATAVLPEYAIDGGISSHSETVSRTLFNPTRRPSPIVATDTTRKQLQRGQFVLTGTTIAGDRSIAFVREVVGNKSRAVRQGDQLNGMLVAEVKTDRVKLTLGEEAEEILLKTAVGPRTTIAPPPLGAAPGQPPFPSPTAGQPDPGIISAATLEERRRAARAARVTPGAAVPTPSGAEPVAVPAPSGAAQAPAPTAAAPGTEGQTPTDPAWAEVYRRMQRNQK